MATQYRQGQALGWMPSAPNVVSTFQTNAAANWFALAFVPDASRTLSAVRVYVSAKAGTLLASDITCDLYDSTGSAGKPGSAVESGKVPASAISAAGFVDWTGFTTALTAGQQYWLVWKNVNATPASNNVSFRSFTGMTLAPLTGSSINRFQWASANSTNSGATWVSGTSTGLRVAYADGSYDGIAPSDSQVAAIGDGVYSTRESGVKFTAPGNGILKVAGVAMFVGGSTGTPTGSPRFGLWTGSTPANLAYTNSLLTTTITGAQWVYSYFASTQTLQPGTVARVTLGETAQSDTSANRWSNQEIFWDTDSNSLALLPFEGTVAKTYFNGSTWADTSGSIFGFALLLDTTGEFGASASAGSTLGPYVEVSEQVWY